ncbi:hypothetical protein Sango_0752900 [Sesamum angolense]|uniref:Uncharacterized protein n=1 Tax=Sesamum angolense TaxID=2727404 RepID=A0AAE1X2P7_9LAMI|nr:hypothetical protein Sango_0752900 [Sesamum angolense]
MDHDDLSRAHSLFPLESCPQVPDEAFNLFHSIDRELYTRLIHNLGRDPPESVQIMAFWMWLEREGSDMNLIRRMLSLPLPLLNELAEETAACLKCVEKDEFHFRDDGISGYHEITLLPEILSSRVVSLRFFHENRIAVLRGVTKIINTVCSRAFNDILQRAWRAGNAAAAADSGGGHVSPAGGLPVQFMRATHEVGESSRAAERRNEGGGVTVPPVMPILYHPYLNVPFVPLPPAASGGLVGIPPPPHPHVLAPCAHRPPPPPPPITADAIGIPIHMVAAGSFPAYDIVAQRQMLSNELGEMLSRSLSISSRDETSNYGEEEEQIAADDRTIFLTFSKGYPITEDEVREFFTRRFGDFIEELIMQEVGEDEQVLYARMVARSPAVIEGIVGGNKAKYSINGKHVWARKYVKKQHQQQSRSPPRQDSTSQQQQGSSSSPSTSASGRGEQF